MKHIKSAIAAVVVLATFATGCSTTASTSTAESGNAVTGSGTLSPQARRELDTGYRNTMARLFETAHGSSELVSKARGVLVFPRVISAGLVIGGQYGEGELRVDGVVDGYYKTTTGSVGLQAGAQTTSLVFVFMTQDALDRFRAGRGWAGGIDASVAVMKLGANANIDVNVARAPTVAFVMTGSGLMANLSLEGTKVTRID
ncbi:YSC84-related protein [Variovorax sp. H27-G14]|uniref:BPSL1445 family SYLF domain-containing lipoprotein n=1 Tax=Variovorax sp. H27-G14 TaxID=3111914 RepID=UPI0038FC18A6